MNRSKPNIFEYVHIADYLVAAYNISAAGREGYSIRSWGRAIGLSSASLLTSVMKKKRRLSRPLAQSLVEYLELDEKEKTYFEALRVLSGLSGLEEKLIVGYLNYLKGSILVSTPSPSS